MHLEALRHCARAILNGEVTNAKHRNKGGKSGKRILIHNMKAEVRLYLSSEHTCQVIQNFQSFLCVFANDLRDNASTNFQFINKSWAACKFTNLESTNNDGVI